MSRYILVLDRNRNLYDLSVNWPASASAATLAQLSAQQCYREPPQLMVRSQWTAVFCKHVTWPNCDRPADPPERGNIYKLVPR